MFQHHLISTLKLKKRQPARENEIATFDAKRLDEETITESFHFENPVFSSPGNFLLYQQQSFTPKKSC